MSRTISIPEFKSIFGDKSLTIIDVRRKADLSTVDTAIQGATWHDPEQISTWSDTLPRDQEIVLYCVRGGSVSNAVVDTLQAKGLKARYIEGGIAAWKDAGGDVTQK
ncbi:rhodanese-like domain-containing protein [Sulfurirhabdus autotrophica]|uniref:Rhodanese-related sulfurtransferase n=1 Tax=Sulfurirhabdus autotrophica TaxID=1706046 RepID=A0A4R3XXN6_9PROT|nr:rhodanese-like domain-containing protein [Sulfurirhabdus autotrophica]TCV82524.1 rhodanese-related sulfurtransferase [Sulfurirhabdus autotrophica]